MQVRPWTDFQAFFAPEWHSMMIGLTLPSLRAWGTDRGACMTAQLDKAEQLKTANLAK